MKQEHIQTIEWLFNMSKEMRDEERILSRNMPSKDLREVRAGSDISALRYNLQTKYIPKVLFIDDDFDQTKKLCYDIAKLVEVEHWAHQHSLIYPLVASIDDHLRASYILFSDHRPLIRKFLDFDYAMYGDTEQDIRTRWRQVERGVAIYGYSMYSLANGDFERVQRCIEVATRLYHKGEHKANHLDLHIEVWQAIEQRDKTRLQRGILTLIKKAHKGMNVDNRFEACFISSPAVGYLKAAWLLGLEVEVDHKYIPMEMMPYAPLPSYEKRYWFLLED
ncbi:hypothetical protein F5984_18955 [Rudanella paleaurantiibacter]|uniref:Uncharacterized protein n=1 Tax=Rudanella paleaurantiibacter TaxID=2614655 RepID=A0A7J5TW39_9BACT|nr:hypothetical protein [Rudanella paleaurantiibacter]KAB7728452.1 hypothetical protein F5984_18955 [Rudanella paleaurantiibacter]